MTDRVRRFPPVAVAIQMRIRHLPVEVEAHGEQVRGRLAKGGAAAGHGVNPVEHDSRAVAPVPVHADGQVVVFPLIEAVQIEVRPTAHRAATFRP